MAYLAWGGLMMAIALSGCSAGFELGPRRALFVPPPVGSAAVIEPDGEEVIEPVPRPAIETVITGLEQAQKVRTLTRQLAR